MNGIVHCFQQFNAKNLRNRHSIVFLYFTYTVFSVLQNSDTRPQYKLYNTLNIHRYMRIEEIISEKKLWAPLFVSEYCLPSPLPLASKAFWIVNGVNKICIEQQRSYYVFPSHTNGKVYCTWNKYTLCNKTSIFV
jgi:hypothetical protein